MADRGGEVRSWGEASSAPRSWCFSSGSTGSQWFLLWSTVEARGRVGLTGGRTELDIGVVSLGSGFLPVGRGGGGRGCLTTIEFVRWMAMFRRKAVPTS
jgi:hypothetical protein